MNTLMVFKHIEKKIVVAQYYSSKEKAIRRWQYLPISSECEIIYLEERKPSGHRYELTYAKYDELGVLYSKYIICFSKKEALYLRKKIEETNEGYVTQIKKLY